MFKKLIFTLSICLLAIPNLTAQKTYASLSKRLVEYIRDGQDVRMLMDSLEKVDAKYLAKELSNDEARKAFWINVYNANIQYLLKRNPELFEKRSEFFKEERITIAGESLSFEDIEHGIIRRSKSPIGLGFLPKLFPGKYERMMRVKKVDARIHCALNCGAKSCPPVVPLDYRETDKQLDALAEIYMNNNSSYDEETNVVYVPKLMLWFSGDWGCKKQKRQFLAQYDVIPKGAKPDIKYNEYDWTLLLNNYEQV